MIVTSVNEICSRYENDNKIFYLKLKIGGTGFQLLRSITINPGERLGTDIEVDGDWWSAERYGFREFTAYIIGKWDRI